MNRIIPLLVFCLISFSGKSQVLEFLNKFEFPIYDTSKYQPFFFRITSGEDLFLSVKTYSIDSILRYEKRATRFDLTQEFSVTEIWFFESGKRKEVFQFDANTGKEYRAQYFESGGMKSKVQLENDQVVLEDYFSESGEKTSKPKILEADFKDGMEGWQKHLSENLEYPLWARRMGESGIVFLSVTVSPEGKMEEIEIANPEEVHSILQKEALRVVEKYPHLMTPKTINGTPVQSQMILHIIFQLS